MKALIFLIKIHAYTRRRGENVRAQIGIFGELVTCLTNKLMDPTKARIPPRFAQKQLHVSNQLSLLIISPLPTYFSWQMGHLMTKIGKPKNNIIYHKTLCIIKHYL